jgi:hypothetical protein
MCLVMSSSIPTSRTQIVLTPHGEDLSAVTEVTRWVARDASRSGFVAQVWTWKNGEAVVLNRTSSSWDSDWVVVIRRGLRCGMPQLVPATTISQALKSLGLTYRLVSTRRRPTPADPSTSEGRRALRRQPLKRAARRKGNQWRTLHAKPMVAAATTWSNSRSHGLA